MLGYGSTFDRPNSSLAQVKAQKSQRPGTSQAPSLRDGRIRDGRIRDQGFEFKIYGIETSEFEIYEFEALQSETQEFTNLGIEDSNLAII